MIELSSAVKCPSVDLMLSGLKNLQKYASDDFYLKKYLPEASKKDLKDLKLRQADIYSIKTKEDQKHALKLVLERP